MGFSQECPVLMAWPAHTTAQGHPPASTVAGFIIYNVRPTNQLHYSNMWSKPKEKTTLIFCSEVKFAALFTYFSLFHHRGTISRNYYVKHYIKKWVLVFFAINNSSHLFWEQECSPELTNIVCFQKCRHVRNDRVMFKNIVCECSESCSSICNPLDCSPPGFSARGIFLARVLGWIAISFFKGSSWPRYQTHIS